MEKNTEEKKNIVKEDCFAYFKKHNECCALEKLDCAGCKFYKKSGTEGEGTKKLIDAEKVSINKQKSKEI